MLCYLNSQTQSCCSEGTGCNTFFFICSNTVKHMVWLIWLIQSVACYLTTHTMVVNKTYQCAYYGVQLVTFIDFDSKQLNKNISKFARKTSEFSFKQQKVVLRLPLFLEHKHYIKNKATDSSTGKFKSNLIANPKMSHVEA